MPRKLHLLTSLLALLLVPAVASSKTFTVTRSFDLGSDGVCNSLCTLREAINAANSNPGPDTVKFAFFMAGSVQHLDDGPLEITDALNIIGLGSNRLAVAPSGIDPAQGSVPAGFPFRILNVSTAVGVDVSISGISLVGGIASGATTDDDRGGIVFHEGADLVLRDVLVAGGSADFEGGGIFSREGSLLIEDSVIGSGTVLGASPGGNAANLGGGIFFESGSADTTFGLTIRRTNLRGNKTTVDHGGGLYICMIDVGVLIESSQISANTSAGLGGGIASIGSADEGRVIIRNSSITGNASGTRGGGLAVDVPGALVLLENLTISGNNATTSGGGVHGANTNGLLQLRGVTVSGNNAAGAGGGVESTDTEPLLLFNSIVGGNTAAADNDLSAVKFFAQASVLEDEGSGNGSGFYIKASPQLNALADYGGPTLTHALTKGSPAVDTGDSFDCANVNANKDQRGQLRTVDGDNDGTTTCDIGAYEFNGRALPCNPTPMAGCTVFPSGRLLLRDAPGRSADNLRLALTRGTTASGFFGDPSHFNGTANAICIYANATSMGPVDTLVGSLNLPAGERNASGATLWKLLNNGSTRYAFAAGNRDGVKLMRQTPNSTGAAIELRAGGENLTLPDIPRRAPVNVEVLVQNQTSDGQCAEIRFAGSQIKTFSNTRFYAVDSTP